MGGTCTPQTTSDYPPHALHQQYLDFNHPYPHGANSTDSGDSINTPKYQIINIDPFGVAFEQPDPVETRKKIEAYVNRKKSTIREKTPEKSPPKRNNDVFIPSEFRKSLLKKRQDRASRSQTPQATRRVSYRERSVSASSHRGSSRMVRARSASTARNADSRPKKPTSTSSTQSTQKKLRAPSKSEPRTRSHTPKPRIAPQVFHPNPSKNMTHLIVYPEYSRSPMPYRQPEASPRQGDHIRRSLSEGRYLGHQRERSLTPLDPLRVHSLPNLTSPPRPSVSFLLPAAEVPEFSRSRSARRSRRGMGARTQQQYSMLGLQAVESQRRNTHKIVAVHRRPSNPNLCVGKRNYQRSPSFGGKRLPDSRSPFHSRSKITHAKPANRLHIKHDPTQNTDLGSYREMRAYE